MRQMVYVALASIALGGCESARVLSHSNERKVGDFELVSSPLDFQHHVVNTKKTEHQICQSPPSSGMLGSSDSVSASAAGDSASVSDGVNASLSARGDASFIASDLLYRVCEFIQNSHLSQEEATALFTQAMEKVGAIGVAAASKSRSSSDDDDDDDDDD